MLDLQSLGTCSYSKLKRLKFDSQNFQFQVDAIGIVDIYRENGQNGEKHS